MPQEINDWKSFFVHLLPIIMNEIYIEMTKRLLYGIGSEIVIIIVHGASLK